MDGCSDIGVKLMALTEAYLRSLLGKHIRDICPLGYAANSDNHCAHFVAHVLGYHSGITCGTMRNGRAPGAVPAAPPRGVADHATPRAGVVSFMALG